MKLLLDEMHAPAVALGLRTRGHDVVAVKGRPEMIGLPDGELLLAATAEKRALVSENVKDFAVLHRMMTTAGVQHVGIVFTHPRRFPRHARNHVAALTGALARFLDEHGRGLRDVESFIWWLEPN